MISIYYEPILKYLNVHSAIAESYTKSHNKELGLDFHRSSNNNKVTGFRLWNLRETVDTVKKLFPGFEAAEFGNDLTQSVTEEQIIYLLKAIFWISEDLEVKELLDLIDNEVKNAA